MRRCFTLACAMLGLATTAEAQGTKKAPIADNSFLMEEAYNQEAGVIQHISLFQKASKGGSWMYAFTEEWPVKGQKNQFSFTLPFAHFEGPGSSSGIGDIMLNWRYQWIGQESENTWVSPRFSLSLPTGDEDKGMGSGAIGYQVALPISHRWNDQVVSHTNAGFTLIPNMTGPSPSVDANSRTLSLGQSFIWQPQDRLNFMVEAVWATTSVKVGSLTSTFNSSYISPGVRWGWDMPSGLQIVPGIAFPIGFGDSKDDNQLLLYLSFEHSVKKN
jgi:hypothetical protein